MGEEPRSRSAATRALWLLLAPLCVSIAVGLFPLAASGIAGASIDLSWALLILLGPSIPVYLVLLPLFPFVFRALRRGWAPGPVSVVGFTLLVSVAVDLLYWLGRS